MSGFHADLIDLASPMSRQTWKLLFKTVLALASAASSARAQTGLSDAEMRADLLRAVQVAPQPRQVDWQRLEFIGFIHFGPNTFTDRSWGTGKENPTVFNPAALDARQWARTLKGAGMKQVILTAKHHDGFCLWPSRFTEHSVKNSPWRGGKGDVVGELAEACREAGLKLGIYLSPADLNAIERGLYGKTEAKPGAIPAPVPGWTPKSEFKMEGNWDDYNAYFLNQLFELLTEYGEIGEVWFDGANPKPGTGQTYAYADWYALIRRLQPGAVIFGKGPDVRWCGNEAGIGRESEWSVIPLPAPPDRFDWPDMTAADLGSRAKIKGAPHLHWYPAEVDVSIRPEWFWHPSEDGKVKSLAQLLDIYHASVGNNAVLLLNVPPDRRGLIHENDAARLAELGAVLRETFRDNLACGAASKASNTRGNLAEFGARNILDGDPETFWMADDWQTAAEIIVELPERRRFNRAMLQEAIRRGQRLESCALDAWIEDGWKELARGTTAGYKRLFRFEMVEAGKLRIRIVSARVAPTLAEFGLFLEPALEEALRAAASDRGVEALVNCQRAVFLGDSITYSGEYIAYLEAFLRARFPDRRFEFLDLGLPSETVSGLSEPGHAGGQFPRPDLGERLERVLARLEPDLVAACYGMNCGIYHPFSDERFQKFQEGLRGLRRAASARGAKVIHLTPPVFDPLPLQGKTLPAGRDGYPQPFEGYDQVLDRYSRWLLARRREGWTAIDLHGSMAAHLAARRRTEPEFRLAGDGVHAGATGHFLMALQIIQALGLEPDENSAAADLSTGKALQGGLSIEPRTDGSIAFTWRARLPMPLDPQWDAASLALERAGARLDRMHLRGANAAAARYEVFEGGIRIASASREEIERGLDLTAYPALGANRRALEMLRLIRERQRLLSDAWLAEIGHRRPGMPRGLPMAEAERRAEELERRIRELARPAELKIRIAPER